MKHILNFKPVVVYRKGSSFLLKMALFLLYLVPAYMGFCHYSTYRLDARLAKTYTELDQRLDERFSTFKKEVEKITPDKEKLEAFEDRYYDYRVLSGVSQTSMVSLLNCLEDLTPSQLKFSSLSIKPEKLVGLRLGGTTTKVEYLTEFLRNLYGNKHFVDPVIKNHRKQRIASRAFAVDEALGEEDYEINFMIEVEYLGEGGELP